MQSRSPLLPIYYVLSGAVKYVIPNPKSDEEENRYLSFLVFQSKSPNVLNIKKKKCILFDGEKFKFKHIIFQQNKTSIIY